MSQCPAASLSDTGVRLGARADKVKTSTQNKPTAQQKRLWLQQREGCGEKEEEKWKERITVGEELDGESSKSQTGRADY